MRPANPLVALLVLLACACGGAVAPYPADDGDGGGTVSAADGSSSAADASSPAADASFAQDDATLAPPDDATVAIDTSVADGARCANSTYFSAPDGGACDPMRIVLETRGSHCFAPPLGTPCDNLQFSFPGLDAAAAPPPFVCHAELGVTTCTYPASPLALDEQALDQACAATRAFPGVTVACIVYE